jgi:hypothetical protein
MAYARPTHADINCETKHTPALRATPLKRGTCRADAPCESETSPQMPKPSLSPIGNLPANANGPVTSGELFQSPLLRGDLGVCLTVRCHKIVGIPFDKLRVTHYSRFMYCQVAGINVCPNSRLCCRGYNQVRLSLSKPLLVSLCRALLPQKCHLP